MKDSRLRLALLALGCLLVSRPLQSQSVSLVKAFPLLTFTQPLFLTHAGDGTNRIFVVQQDGKIFAFPNDSTAAAASTFLDIGAKLSSSSDEQGLLGLAFHPQFATNGYFYVNYTAPNPLRTVIARYKVSTLDPNKADTASAFTILEIGQPYTNHNGGMIAFGADGDLYIGMGDGGSANDPSGNGQNKASLLGKMLRINVNDTTATAHYTIPPDNPLVGNGSGWREELWAWGLRNPWRWSFDPPTGTLWVGDVGQDTREEIDTVRKGGNYGWNIMEGFICRPGGSSCDTTGLLLPIKDYPHTLGIAVTGGYVYRGSRAPFLTGAYVYGDYGSGRIWMLRVANGIVSADSQLIQAPFAISSFGTDQSGELYIVAYDDGSMYRFAANTSPTSVQAASGMTERFELEQNYPNPFNPSTTITYQLPVAGAVRLAVYDILGREVAVLVHAVQGAGRHSISWDATGIASGVYFSRLTTVAGTLTRNMILAR